MTLDVHPYLLHNTEFTHNFTPWIFTKWPITNKSYFLTGHFRDKNAFFLLVSFIINMCINTFVLLKMNKPLKTIRRELLFNQTPVCLGYYCGVTNFDWKLLQRFMWSVTFNLVYVRIQRGLTILILEFDYTLVKRLFI